MAMTLERVSEVLSGASLNVEHMEHSSEDVGDYLSVTGSLVEIPVAVFVTTEGDNPHIRMQTYVKLKEDVTSAAALYFAHTLNTNLSFCRFYFIEDDDEEESKYMYGSYFLDNEHPIGEKLLIKSVIRLASVFVHGFREYDEEGDFIQFH